MSDKPFFDTTILIYSIAEADPRAAIAEKLLTAGGYISVQVLNEFTAVARGKLKMRWKETREALLAIRALCEEPAPVTAETHEAALGLAERFGYTVYDALILAAAIENGCKILYSEDMQHGQQIRGLRIQNPFKKY